MRVREMLVLGALTFGAMACGDSLAPEAGEGRDLDFVLPTVTGELPDSARYRTWDEPVTASDIAKARGVRQANAVEGSPDDDGGGPVGGDGGGTGGTSGGGGGAMILPIIRSTYAIGYFEGDVARIEYGMSAFGTGHTMTASLKVYGENGTVILNENGTGRKEDAPIYSPMRPSVRERFLVPSWCGATAQLRVKFEVRVALAMLAAHELAMTQANEENIFAQAKCAPRPDAPTDGGNGGGIGDRESSPAPGGSGSWLCFFVEWIDQDGFVIEKQLIGCKYIGGELLRA